MSEKLLKSEKSMSRQEAAEKIHSLADKIGEGNVDLKARKDSVKLKLPDQVEFEVEVEKERDGDTSIEIEVEWAENQEDKKLEIQ